MLPARLVQPTWNRKRYRHGKKSPIFFTFTHLHIFHMKSRHTNSFRITGHLWDISPVDTPPKGSVIRSFAILFVVGMDKQAEQKWPVLIWDERCFGLRICIPVLCGLMWSNYPSSQIPQCTGSNPHNAPFRIEMCTFLFWMVHCGVSNRCIVEFVILIYWPSWNRVDDLWIKSAHWPIHARAWFVSSYHPELSYWVVWFQNYSDRLHLTVSSCCSLYSVDRQLVHTV